MVLVEDNLSVYGFSPTLRREQRYVFFAAAIVVGLLQIPIMIYMMKEGHGYIYAFSWCLACNIFLFLWFAFAKRGKIPYITDNVVTEVFSVSILCISAPIYFCYKVFYSAAPDSELFLTFANNNSDLVGFLESLNFVSRTAVPQEYFKPKFILTYMLFLSAMIAGANYIMQIILLCGPLTQSMMVTFKKAKTNLAVLGGFLFYLCVWILVSYKFLHPDFSHVPELGKTYISGSKRVLSLVFLSGCSVSAFCFAGLFRYLYREKLNNEFVG